MKIFNWIQRHRFPYNVHPSEVSLVEDGSSVRRSGSSIRKDDREPLLEEEVKADWELDRILTIGTLAIDPLNTINLQDEEGYNGEEEEPYNHNDHDQDDKNDCTILLKEDDPKCEIEMCKLYVHKLRDVVKRCSDEIEEVEEEIMYEKLTNLGKRVTLLDLFLADGLDNVKVAEKENPADEYVEEDDDNAKEIKMKKKKTKLILYKKLASALGGKKGFSSKAKKLIHDYDVPPLKKLHRFMARMMKKKIHPDMEARVQKKGQVKLNDDVPMGIDAHAPTNGKYAATESVFLLPSQGIMV